MERELIFAFLGLYALLVIVLYKMLKMDKKLDNVNNNAKYDPSITLWKFFTQLLFGGASFVVLDVVSKYVTGLQQVNSSIAVIVLIAVLNAVVNFVKNR